MSTPLSDAPSPRRLQRVPSARATRTPAPVLQVLRHGNHGRRSHHDFPEHPERPAENLCRRHAREALVTHDPIAQARDRLRLACQAERAAKDETDAAGHALDELLRAGVGPSPADSRAPCPAGLPFPHPQPEKSPEHGNRT